MSHLFFLLSYMSVAHWLDVKFPRDLLNGATFTREVSPE